MPLFDMSTLVLPLILALIVLVLATALIALTFETRRRRLPAATQLEDVAERLAVAQAALERADETLAARNAQIHDRDRYAAEVAVLLERIEALRAESATLEPARQEIEAVKAEAAKAAEELAAVKTDLRDATAELEAIRRELDPDRIERLRREKADAEQDIAELKSQLADLEARAAEARRVLAESEARAATAAALDERIAELRADAEAARAALAPLAEEGTRLRLDVERLRAELPSLEDRRAALVAQTAQMEERLASLSAEEVEARRAIEPLRQQRDQLAAAAAELQRLEERKDWLVARIAKLEEQTGEARQDENALLADLLAPAACLAEPAVLRANAPWPETEALHHVDTALTAQGLAYAPRTLRAFHTALKINDNAQITVLAGVSGTGKSLLPRAYARALGIHFLQIAVEPRWDSPQDLLGFYNYVEKRYRATDLARVLLQADPHRTHALPEGTPDRSDRVTLVLLDEMNLARVEYYFSEFLSRLEARPRHEFSQVEERRRDALIPLDIRGMERPPTLYPAHNILFAGTMNDDESTQALSDKVLDRGNILQFPAPTRFATPMRAAGSVTAEALPFRTWRSWARPLPDGPLRGRADEVIARLARIMQGFGRPFGHRLRDAMLAYVANYPVETPTGGDGTLDMRVPLADQIELRLLPKLRGVEIERHAEAFDALEALLRTDLDDSVFADALNKRREELMQGTGGLFVWNGLARGAGE